MHFCMVELLLLGTTGLCMSPNALIKCLLGSSGRITGDDDDEDCEEKARATPGLHAREMSTR